MLYDLVDKHFYWCYAYHQGVARYRLQGDCRTSTHAERNPHRVWDKRIRIVQDDVEGVEK